MARIRSIKPDFFLHEGLAELSALHRLLFIGLWTLADKEGRLEDRPKRIKAAILPWENCDVEALLRDLDAGGFIHRYEADETRCIAIPSFEKHQRPHPKELGLNLPAPPSREVSRPAVNSVSTIPAGFSSIPSSPPGKEILENGSRKEISENKGAPSFFGNAPRQEQNSSESQKPQRPTSENASLQDRMNKIWLEYRAGPYTWRHQDETALRGVLRLADGNEARILERWDAALRRDGYPRCGSVSDLERKWTDYVPERVASRGDKARV